MAACRISVFLLLFVFVFFFCLADSEAILGVFGIWDLGKKLIGEKTFGGKINGIFASEKNRIIKNWTIG